MNFILCHRFQASGFYIESTQWELCIDVIDGYLAQFTGYLYVMRHLPRTTKDKVCNELCIEKRNRKII